jgi:hypothetical protein
MMILLLAMAVGLAADVPADDHLHVYSDCSSPPTAGDPKGCDWHATLNLSAATTVVDGSKEGGQLLVDVEGGVTWRSARGDSSLVHAAHANGVRALPIVGPKAGRRQKPGDPPFTYRKLFGNATALARAAASIAAMSFSRSRSARSCQQASSSLQSQTQTQRQCTELQPRAHCHPPAGAG